MELNEYQEKCTETATYPGSGTISGLIYTTLGLNGEAGEVAEKVKKIMRDDGCEVTPEKKREIALELGDVFYYLAESARNLGFKLSFIAELNNAKLHDRKMRNAIGGSGDNR